MVSCRARRRRRKARPAVCDPPHQPHPVWYLPDPEREPRSTRQGQGWVVVHDHLAAARAGRCRFAGKVGRDWRALTVAGIVSTCPHLPSQIAKSGPFANELSAEQYAEQQDRRYREAGQKIESDQYCNDAARQEPTPVRKGSYRQRKDHLRNALNHEVYEQQKREHEKARRPMTNQKHADYHRQDNRDKLKPEMRHVARVDETDALHDTTKNQDTAQEKDRSERRYHRVDQRKNSSENHQTALYKIPKRMPLDRLAHRLAHSSGGSFE